MAIGEIIRRELRFDVGNRNIAADAHILALGNVRKPEIQVIHHGIEAVGLLAGQVLIAEDAVAERVLVIGAVNSRKAASPIEMIALHLIGRALYVQRHLVELHGIGLV